MNPDPLYAENDLDAEWVSGFNSGQALGRSSFRWYLLASFVTGLLLGAAVARL